MYVRTLLVIIALGFATLQMSESLDCYSCNSPASCSNPSSISCSDYRANQSIAYFSQYFQDNLTSIASGNVDCFLHSYTSATTNLSYRGCIYRQISPCKLTLKAEYSSLRQKKCKKCSANMCNPAAGLSYNKFGIIGSIFTIAFYTFLSM